MSLSKLSIDGNWAIKTTYTDDSRVPNLTGQFTFGVGTIPRIDIDLALGTGSEQSDWLYFDEKDLAASGNDDYDFYGGLTDIAGAPINAATLKLLAIAIKDPGSAKSLRIGPQSVTNAMTGPFNATSAYLTITNHIVLYDPFAGWTVTNGSADTLRINNPSAGQVTYQILMSGVKA